MKKNNLTNAMTLISMALIGSTAQANVCGPVGETCISAALLASTLLPSELTSSTTSQREAYVNQLKDDAAQFVAQGGAPTALLKEAMDALREKNRQIGQATDLEIAQAIIAAN